MKYKLCLLILALPILLVACNQKKTEAKTVDAATDKATEVAKEMNATAAKAEGTDTPKEQESSKEEPNKAKPGDEFIKTAKQYQEKSDAAREAGDAEKAGIYAKLAEIKREAAAAVNEGKGYDWTLYYDLVKQLE